ncbi:MAG: hypothetical protein ACU843_14680 [Gammaproteobacteria bacterium]
MRARNLTMKGIQFFGIGVSSGEAGAPRTEHQSRRAKRGYERVRSVREAVVAKVDGVACVTWLGPGSAGHFVKMVHNGIGYGVMKCLPLQARQLGAETS